MKPSQNSIGWPPFTDNVKKDHAIVDNKLIGATEELDLSTVFKTVMDQSLPMFLWTILQRLDYSRSIHNE